MEEVLYRVFRHSYSPQEKERKEAEAFLKQAEFQPGLLPALLHVTNAAQEIPIRQAAAIQLKNQLRQWHTLGGEASYSEEDKVPIRQQLVDSVVAAVGEKGVRVQLAECFRLVALHDFPDHWPGIVERLVAGLCSEQSAETMCSLLLLRQLLKIVEMKPAERRGDLEQVATASLPVMLRLSPLLVKAAHSNTEAFEMLKLVLKCFYSATRWSIPSQVRKDIQHWMELLLTVSEWKMEVPAGDFEEEVQEATCEAKCRKWVFQILLRFYQKHSHSRRLAEGMEDFAKAWNDTYEVAVARACLQEACARPPGAWVPKKSLCLALLCLSEACRREGAFEALKPNLQQLLEHGIFPQVRFGEAQLKLWQEDPEELLRELLSDTDSDSQPHQAAIDLVERLLLYHHKEILFPLLHFCRQHLETEAQDPASCSNQDGALVLLGLMVEYLVDLDPIQMEDKVKKRKGKSKASQSVSIEDLISRYVRPAMTSHAAFLRLRGAWCLGHFCQKASKLGRPGVAAGACCDCLKMLADQELPVRVVAASCLEALLSREGDQEVYTAVSMQLAPAMEALLRTLADVHSEEVASALQSLVECFPNEVVPFAVQLVVTLAKQFCLSLSTENHEPSEGQTSADNNLATIISVLQACAGLQRPEEIWQSALASLDVQAQSRTRGRVVAVRDRCTVAQFSEKLTSKARSSRLSIDGFTIPPWEKAIEVFRDGDVVDLFHEVDRSTSAVKVGSAAPISESQKSQVTHSRRSGFVTADLRQKLFGQAAQPEPPQELAVEEIEEPRSRVSLSLVSERVNGWRLVLKDESRRSFAAHFSQALSKDTAQRFFENAINDVKWQQPEGTWGPIPRKTSWMTRSPCRCRYGYGGLRMEPEPMAKWVDEAMALCMPLCGIAKEDWPDSCNLNLYEDGDHSVGWHADDEVLFQGKFQDCLIISLSLGAPRSFEMKTIAEPVDFHRLVLDGGDLCTMEGMLQKHYLHRVPKSHSTSPRVNLTWRWVQCHEWNCSRKRSQDDMPDQNCQSPKKQKKLHCSETDIVSSHWMDAMAASSSSRTSAASAEEILQLRPEDRAEWLKQALNDFKEVETILGILRHPDFLKDVEDPVAPRIYRWIHAHQLKFTEEQSNSLEPVCNACIAKSPEVQEMQVWRQSLREMKEEANNERWRLEAERIAVKAEQDPREQQRRCALFGSLAEPLLPVVAQTLRPDGIQHLEEGLQMLTYLTAFSSTPMPATLWEPFPAIFQALYGGSTASRPLPQICENGWAADHMGNFLEPLLNYVARGTNVILTQSWAEGNRNYCEMIFCMVKKVLHLPGLGAEQDAAAAADLGASLFAHAAPPAADAWLGAYLCEFCKMSGHRSGRRYVLLLALLAVKCPSFVQWQHHKCPRVPVHLSRRAKEADQAGWLDQAVWKGAEVLGQARASLVGEAPSDPEIGEVPSTREELVERLRADYDRNYFLTGDIDVPLYTEDCEFADPFTSFRGRQRFVQNLKNLAGGFITNFKVKLLEFTVAEDEDPLLIRSRLLVQLELALPWRPLLGWVWGVDHRCASSNVNGTTGWQCFLHKESWEVSASEGVAMVFRPGKGSGIKRTRLSGETGTHELRRSLLVAMATLLWYNPELFLRCCEEKGFTAQLFEVWMQKLSAVTRKEHRKVTLLAFLQLFRLGCAQVGPVPSL
eukprot:symbB.v1.2.016593.t1/scaffold1264.1/size127839/2